MVGLVTWIRNLDFAISEMIDDIKGAVYMCSRDNFSVPVKRALAERVGYKCSNPFCRITTIGAQQGGEGTVSIGEAAHICAAAPGGKRYDPNMTPEERSGYDNGIWLCRTHAALIDRDEKFFTIKMLKDWKIQAEKGSSQEILGNHESINVCKVRIKVFYKDLEECRKWIEIMKRKRGIIIDPTNFPIQNDWENKVIELSSVIGADIASELIRVLRELEEMKIVMNNEIIRTQGRRMADNGTIKYCNRYDVFMERMDSWLTNEFMEAIAIFAEI